MPASMQPRSIYPIRHMLAHLQPYNHGAILFEGDQRAAQVINLGHGGTSIGFAQRQRCQTFAAVPIASGPLADIDWAIWLLPLSPPSKSLRWRQSCARDE